MELAGVLFEGRLSVKLLVVVDAHGADVSDAAIDVQVFHVPGAVLLVHDHAAAEAALKAGLHPLHLCRHQTVKLQLGAHHEET